MKKRLGVIFTVIVMVFGLTGCNIFVNQEKLEEQRNDLQRRVEDDFLPDFQTTYIVGDTLPTTFGDVQIEWVLNSDKYFDNETLECLGSDGEDRTLTITARFVETDDVFVEKSITIIILDNFIRNNEDGIADAALYGYILAIVDADNDNKISRAEAINYVGPFTIIRDGTGHLSDEITTTSGLELFPNITSLTFQNIYIQELEIQNFQDLRSIEFITSSNSVIKDVYIANTPRLDTVSFGTLKIEDLTLDGNFYITTLDLSYKDLRSVTILGNNGTLKQLNLNGNTQLDSYSFLGRFTGLEKLELSGSNLDTNKANSIPFLGDLKVLDISHNDTISNFTFITSTRFPDLEVIDFTSTPVEFLSLKDFQNLQEIILENIRTNDVSGMNSLELSGLPSFTTLTRNTDTTMLNVIVRDMPLFKSLDLSFDVQFTIASLIVDNVAITELILSDNTMLHSASFSDCYSLKTMNLSNTRLDSITFSGMDALEELIFDQITDVDNYAFLSEAPNLIKLSVAANDLTDSKMSYVTTMDNLLELNISYNSDISDYSFLSAFVVLEYLNLGFNDINTLAFNSIPLLPSLVELDISDNPNITDIELSDMPNLFTLNISSNVAEWYIDTLVLDNLASFKEFVRTATTKINHVTLTDLPILERFNLGHSDVQTITITNVEMLKELDVSYNSNVAITID